ncbi:hypothetical protein OO012_19580 [Rhodobacteraceae bacterium KMM 6894]|nr:hypothetical protein [Rhodobacteraceae bacterium KMM 6894]
MTYFNAILALGAAVALSACVPAQERLTQSGARLNVAEVIVDTSQADKEFGSSSKLDKARAARIADQILTARLEQADDDGGKPVVVYFTVTQLYLAHGALAVMGSTNSSIGGTLSVRDKASGTPVVQGAVLRASGSSRLGGLIGVAQIEEQEQEMALVSTGVAEKIAQSLFGDGPVAKTAPVAAAPAETASAPSETMEEYNARMQCEKGIKICL